MAENSMPDRLWLGCADADNENQVWFESGEGGTEYVRADSAHARGKQEPIGYIVTEYATEKFCDPLEFSRQPLTEADKKAGFRGVAVYTAPPAESEEVARLRAKMQWAVETLTEINVNNHSYEDVCDLNAASVEVSFGLEDALAARPAPADHIAGVGKPITFVYRNWRGEVAERTVLPKRLWWGVTEWHPEPQWLMSGTDVEKGEDRDFALKDMQFASQKETDARDNAACLEQKPSKPKVKALGPWRRGYCDNHVTIEQASFGGLYQVRVLNGVINLDWPDRSPPSVFGTMEKAKTAAQADYERRILSAIEGGEDE